MNDQALDIKAAELPVDTGIAKKDCKRLAGLLNDALASSYVLYAKTHSFHWNVVGPLFYGIHKLTDEQDRDLADAIDAIAERIRAVGYPAGGGLESYLARSRITESGKVPRARELVAVLAQDHQTIAAQMREAVAEAEAVEDVYTADLLTRRIGFHEEAAWMLNAIAAD